VELGKLRTEGLFYDQLGTDPLDASERSMKIALTGWAANETIVTDFIGRMQRSKTFTGVSLASLERQAAGGTCRFRLYCTLKLADK
jgi:hypothetical protein